MLRKIIIEINGNKELVEKNFLGYETYSAILKIIESFYKEKSDKYHQKNIKKPFTIIPPFIYQEKQEKIFFKINFLTDEIFSLFFSSFFNLKNIKIRENFVIKKIYLKKEEKMPIIFKNELFYYEKKDKKTNTKEKEFIIKTITPFIFKQGNQYITLPTEEKIKNSFYQHQKNIYQKTIYFLPDFKIIETNLKTTKVTIKPFNTYIASFGKIKIKVKEEKDIKALSFFGIGTKTAMGLGQIKIINLEKDENFIH